MKEIITILSTIFILTEVFSCECPEYKSDSIQIELDSKRSDWIISGKVLSFFRVDELDDGTDAFYRIQLKKVYKGTISEKLEGFVSTEIIHVRSDYSGGLCGFPFKVGQEYLIYAFRNELGEMETNSCVRTRNINDAEKDISIITKIVQR